MNITPFEMWYHPNEFKYIKMLRCMLVQICML